MLDCPLITHQFFFFQAEDGIRDIGVTGVQTCALPILATMASLPGLAYLRLGEWAPRRRVWLARAVQPPPTAVAMAGVMRERSEERRGGEEGRTRWAPYH